MYTPTKVNVCIDQHDKLKNAISDQKPISIKLNTQDDGREQQHTLLLTGSQIAKINRSKLIGKRQVSIRFSKRQVQANVHHQGGFLGMLTGLAAKALPSLLSGLATGLVSGAVKRAVAGRGILSASGGNGLYLHKSGHCVKVEPVKCNGLYLTPHQRLSGLHGDGLYLKRGSTIQEGSGLILGPNSPFKNIPILNLLL